MAHERKRRFFLPFVVTVFASALNAQSAPTATLDVQAHRGASGLLPDNSMASFEQALAFGAATLELDIQATRDRVLVVHHDACPSRKLCIHDDGGKVSRATFGQRTFEELGTIDCGQRRRLPTQALRPGTRIPRLEEVLVLARDAPYPVQLSIEIKQQKRRGGVPLTEVVDILLARLEEHGLKDRTIIQSFDPEALVVVREADPSVRRSYLVRWPRRYKRLLEDDLGTILSPRFSFLSESDVKRFQERGVTVIPWTLNDPGDIRRALSWGVDGVISDYPDRVLEILKDGS